MTSKLWLITSSSEADDGELLLLEAPTATNAWLEPAASKSPTSSSTSANGSRLADLSGPASLLDVINQSFEVMQTSLAQYKIAGYPPDILINIPKRVCRSFEFYKAPELIQLGRIIAHDTLDKYERDNA